MSTMVGTSHSALGGNLPDLVRRAAASLASAETPAELLIAREAAGLAYSAGKATARIAKASKAHQSIVILARRAQADALEIEAQADVRLADEVDQAKAKGSFRTGRHSEATTEKFADFGLKRKHVHDVRKLRDAIASQPGALRLALDDILETGAEPTRAFLRRELFKIRSQVRPKKKPTVAPASKFTLCNGRDVRGMAWADIADLKASISREMSFLNLIENYVANADPETIVGSIISESALNDLFLRSKGLSS